MIRVGENQIEALRVFGVDVDVVRIGETVVFNADEPMGATIIYSFANESRTLEIEQSSSTGADTFVFDDATSELTVTTTYEEPVGE